MVVCPSALSCSTFSTHLREVVRANPLGPVPGTDRRRSHRSLLAGDLFSPHLENPGGRMDITAVFICGSINRSAVREEIDCTTTPSTTATTGSKDNADQPATKTTATTATGVKPSMDGGTSRGCFGEVL